MPRFVVDASVAAKWLVYEEFDAHARNLLAGEHILVAPTLLPVEVVNVLWTKTIRADLTPALAREAALRTGAFPLRLVESSLLLPAAIAIALEHRRSVYDSLYLALALREECPLVTADRRFYNAVRDQFAGSLLWVEEVPPA